jgi:hypothetical protein
MTVADHLTLNELWRRAKKAKDPIEKDRFLAVYHAKRGLTAKEIARIIPNTPRWVQETVRRYNLEGPEALKDKRHQNPGVVSRILWVKHGGRNGPRGAQEVDQGGDQPAHPGRGQGRH